jgi:protein-S-isoprenylcysteine O-methyltransferase Ste14
MKNSAIAIPQKGMISAIAGRRVVVSRIFAVVVLPVLLFTGHSFSQFSVVDIALEVSGLFLLSVCSLGRLWALMYISGKKGRELVTDGPYSMVRHPLYVFSLIGAVGIGLASENLLVLALIVIFYLSYYPFTILAEERKLTNKFGEVYLEYAKRTPRFLPKFSLHKEPETYQVKAAGFVHNFVDGMWFIWIFMLMHAIEMLQNSGFLPVLLRVP